MLASEIIERGDLWADAARDFGIRGLGRGV